jgi:hypothetical protein
MPYGIDDDDWPWFKRMLKDYKAGRFGKKPKTEERPKVGRRGLLLGRTVDAIEQGKTGKIVRLQGKKGEEKPIGPPFDAYNRFGDLEAEQVLLYAHIGRGKEIVQSWCAENEETANEEDA